MASQPNPYYPKPSAPHVDPDGVVVGEVYYPAAPFLPTSTAPPAETFAIDVDSDYPQKPTNPYYPPPAQPRQQPNYPVYYPQQPAETAAYPAAPASEMPATYTVVHAPPSQGCCGVQWVLFAFGIFFYFPALIGACLPCCSRSMMRGKERPGWIANIVLSALTPAFCIALEVFGGVSVSGGDYYTYSSWSD